MKKIGIDFKMGYECLDIGCGNNNFALNLEEISSFKIDQIDVDSDSLKNSSEINKKPQYFIK